VSYHQGFLYFSNAYGNAVEVVNHARTAALMQAAINSGLASRFGMVLANGGCPALNYNPCTMATDGSTTSWAVLTGPGLVANAPWYRASSAASAEALGFYIEEWTGLDGSHHGREMVPFGAARGGGMPGKQVSGPRVMAFNVILIGRSNRGLNYLFRWLESTLLACCDPNDSSRLWMREYCTDSADLTDGLAYTDDVALVAGPTWESPPVDDGGCFLRRVSFTLTAGSPSFFREPTTVASGTGTTVSLGTFGGATALPLPLTRNLGLAARIAGSMVQPEYGLVSPIVTITSNYTTSPTGGRTYLPRMRIYGLLNPTGLPATTTDLSRMYPIGALVLDNIPSGSKLEVDVGAGKVWITDYPTSLERINGMWTVQPTAPTFATGSVLLPDTVGARLPRWFSFNNCQDGIVVVEPDTSPTLADALSVICPSWSVTIQSSMRFGSC
jgi:hypothetical protein